MVTINDANAISIIESLEEPTSEQEFIAAWQHIIDNGLCWKLQGFYGRNAINLIQCGVCNPPPNYRLNEHGKLEPIT